MINNRIVKEIKALNDLHFLVEKQELNTCSKILDFAEAEGSKETVDCIEKYRNTLKAHIDAIYSDYKLLLNISKELLKLKYDELKEQQDSNIVIGGIDVFFSTDGKDIRCMFSLGYDSYYELHKYAYLEFEVYNKGKLYQKEEKIVFSREENLQEYIYLDSIKYLDDLIDTLNNATSISDLKIAREAVELKLKELLRVGNLNEYLSEEDEGFEELYGISNVKLGNKINSAYYKREIQLKLMAIGIDNPSDDLVKLIGTNEALSMWEEDRETEIKFFGEDKYNKILEGMREKRFKLLNELELNMESLADISDKIKEMY